MSLRDYTRKRTFSSTPEPTGAAGSIRKKAEKQPIFVVQLHHASHRHYDFRLEVDGTLKSWAVPKGPSLRPGEKRLAVQVEDHPLSYAKFEGDIPQGNYGAGNVRIFDRGTWSTPESPRRALADGTLNFVLQGDRLKGAWKLVRTRRPARQPQWLLFKRDDEYAMDADADDLVDSPAGVKPATRGKIANGSRIDATSRSVRKPVSTMTAKDSRRSGSRSSKWRSRALTLDGAKLKKLAPGFAPQLATLREKAPVSDDWLHEIKWDGYRLLAELDAGKALLRTRGGLDWTSKFPGIANAIEALPVDSARIDGELVALDDQGRSDFSLLQHALKSGRSADLRYLVFDLPALAGVDLRHTPLLQRKELLEELLIENPSAELAYSRHIVGSGDRVFAASKGQGVEGIVSKRVDARYEHARSASWVKIKHENTDEFVVVGYTKPKGSRSNFGALLMATKEDGGLRYVGKVGTGYDDAALRELFQLLSSLEQDKGSVTLPAHAKVSPRAVHWVKPQLVAEVAFRGWAKEGLLRQAAFKRLREDKSFPNSERAAAEVKITSPTRIVYKAAKITKGQVADYYRAIAPWLLPELARRPLSLLRCPGGIDASCFFQKHYLDSLGKSVKAIPLRQKSGTEDYIYVDDVQGVLALVQMNTLEFHPWGSQVGAPEQPDRMVFDLDPADDVDWKRVVIAAKDVRDRLAEAGLQSFVRVTGGKGLHVVAPIKPGPSWDELKDFCGTFAQAMAAHRPEIYVATMSKAKRTNKIFIDWLRNSRGSTSVTSWSLRARPGAPVAVPLRWEELDGVRASNSFDIAKALRRAESLDADPWAEIYRVQQRLPGQKSG
jgi:bifunctional non-homologous end joining protein LigD